MGESQFLEENIRETGSELIEINVVGLQCLQIVSGQT